MLLKINPEDGAMSTETLTSLAMLKVKMALQPFVWQDSDSG